MIANVECLGSRYFDPSVSVCYALAILKFIRQIHFLGVNGVTPAYV